MFTFPPGRGPLRDKPSFAGELPTRRHQGAERLGPSDSLVFHVVVEHDMDAPSGTDQLPYRCYEFPQLRFRVVVVKPL